jgi:hypothetical protein
MMKNIEREGRKMIRLAEEREILEQFLKTDYGIQLKKELISLTKEKKIEDGYLNRVLSIKANEYYRYSIEGNAWKCLGLFLKLYPELFTLNELIQMDGEVEKYIYVINSKMEKELEKILKYKDLIPTKQHRELPDGRIITFYTGFLNEPKQYLLENHPVRCAFRIAEKSGIRIGYYYYHEKPKTEGYFSISNIRSFPIKEDEFGDYSSAAGGFREDLNAGFKSTWEANIARILNYQSVQWEYENAIRSFSTELGAYIPDFIVYRENIVQIIEVKGRWDFRSVKKVTSALSQVKKEKIIIIDSDFYSLLDQKYKDVIPNWEKSSVVSGDLELPVVGITLGKRKSNVKNLKIRDSLKFVREPDNPYDPNAILVLTSDNEEIGFVAKDWASIFSFKIDHGFTYEVTVNGIEEKVVKIKVKTEEKSIRILENIGF